VPEPLSVTVPRGCMPTWPSRWRTGRQTLTQLTIPWVVLTCQNHQQRLAAGKNKGQGGRVNWVDYIHISIPLAFAYPILMPLLNGLATNLDTTTITDNYVWVTAGWGNKSRPAECQFQTPTGPRPRLTRGLCPEGDALWSVPEP